MARLLLRAAFPLFVLLLLFLLLARALAGNADTDYTALCGIKSALPTLCPGVNCCPTRKCVNLFSALFGKWCISPSSPPCTGDISNWWWVSCSKGRVSSLDFTIKGSDYTPTLGPIPSSIGGLDAMTRLNLGLTSVRGTIPSEIGQLKNLSELSMHGGESIFFYLNGTIPSTISKLTKLTSLDLGNNGLAGQIPSGLGGLTGLTSLALNNNQLTGPIPSGLRQLTKLTVIYLNDNQLTGPIPSSVCSLQPTNINLASNNGLACWPCDFKVTSLDPTVNNCPTAAPTPGPTPQPTNMPTPSPTGQPTSRPSHPTGQPSRQPSGQPSRQPTQQPTRQPTGQPSVQPSRQPTAQPSRQPASRPTGQPTRRPTAQPSRQPTRRPTGQPSRQPSVAPSRPSGRPTSQPSRQPSRQPSAQPSRQPSGEPSRKPSRAPSRQPSGQPSNQPASIPTSRPSGQPSTRPTTLPTLKLCPPGHFLGLNSLGHIACQACSPGSQSHIPDSLTCRPCEPGSFSQAGQVNCTLTSLGSYVPVVGAYAPQQCKAGSFSAREGASACKLCPMGSYASATGAKGCEQCAVQFFSDILGSTACTKCPGGRITPFKGSVSISQCLSPEVNFYMGGAALLLAAIAGGAYVVMGGYHYTAFIRRERVVLPQAKKYFELSVDVKASEKEMSEHLWRVKMKKKIAAALKKGDKKSNKCYVFLRTVVKETFFLRTVVKETFKTVIFCALAIVSVALVTVTVFALLLARVFFQALIIWKQSRSFSDVLDYRSVVQKVTELVFEVLKGFPIYVIWPLRKLLDVLFLLFDYLSFFKIDWSAVGVTCAGAGAPFQLLLDLAILGMVIVIIESDFQSFRGLSFHDTLERCSMRLLSREYPKYKLNPPDGPKKLFYQKIIWFFYYFLMLICMLLLQVIFFVVNFQSLLQFLVTLTQTSVFAKGENYLHLYSPNCNQITGMEDFDKYLAYGSSFLAYALVLPLVYEISKILCPKENLGDKDKHRVINSNAFCGLTCCEKRAPDEENKKGVQEAGKRPQAVDEHDVALDFEKEENKKNEEPPSISQLLCRLPKSAWPRLLVVIWAPDMLLAHLTQGLLSMLSVKKDIKEEDDRKKKKDDEQATTNYKSDGGVRELMEELGIEKNGVSSYFLKQLHSFLSLVTVMLPAIEPDSKEDTRWWKDQAEIMIPSYLELVQEELYSLSCDSKWLAPPSVRRMENNDKRYPIVGYLFCVVLVLVPVGHLLTTIGRFCCYLVCRKYVTFILASIGIWSDRSLTAYEIDRKVSMLGLGGGAENVKKDDAEIKPEHDLHPDEIKVMKDGLTTSERSLKYASCISSTIATRAILLQIIPQFAMWSIFTIATCDSPLFVPKTSKLYYKLASSLMLDCFTEARRVEEMREVQQGKPRSWIVILNGISMFILESRLIKFIVSAFMTGLSIYIVYWPPSIGLILAAVIILIPVALAYGLRLAVVLGRGMNIKDIYDIKCGKKSPGEDEAQADVEFVINQAINKFRDTKTMSRQDAVLPEIDEKEKQRIVEEVLDKLKEDKDTRKETHRRKSMEEHEKKVLEVFQRRASQAPHPSQLSLPRGVSQRPSSHSLEMQEQQQPRPSLGHFNRHYIENPLIPHDDVPFRDSIPDMPSDASYYAQGAAGGKRPSLWPETLRRVLPNAMQSPDARLEHPLPPSAEQSHSNRGSQHKTPRKSSVDVLMDVIPHAEAAALTLHQGSKAGASHSRQTATAHSTAAGKYASSPARLQLSSLPSTSPMHTEYTGAGRL